MACNTGRAHRYKTAIPTRLAFFPAGNPITELGQGDTVLQTEFLPGQTAVTPLDNKGEHVISTLFHILIILSVKLQQNNHSENMYLVGRIRSYWCRYGKQRNRNSQSSSFTGYYQR